MITITTQNESPIAALRFGQIGGNDKQDPNLPFFTDIKNIRMKTDLTHEQIRVFGLAFLIAKRGTFLAPPAEKPLIPELEELAQYMLELAVSKNRMSRSEWQIIQSAIKASTPSVPDPKAGIP